MWCGASAAASPSMLASLAPRQCGIGGRMLGSNFNTISLDDTKNTRTKNISKFDQLQETSQPTAHRLAPLHPSLTNVQLFAL